MNNSVIHYTCLRFVIILQIIFNVNKKRDVTQSLQIEWFQTSVFNYRKNLFSFGIMLNRMVLNLTQQYGCTI